MYTLQCARGGSVCASSTTKTLQKEEQRRNTHVPGARKKIVAGLQHALCAHSVLLHKTFFLKKHLQKMGQKEKQKWEGVQGKKQTRDCLSGLSSLERSSAGFAGFAVSSWGSGLGSGV